MSMTPDELLTTTRAVRKRLDLERPVPREVIEECLGIAVQAPTGSNSQGWRWVVVTDPDKKAVIADCYRRAWEVYSSAGRSSLESLPEERAKQMKRVISSSEYLAQNLERVPVHVIPCLQGVVGESVPAAMAPGFFGSIYPAVWSFQLALRSRGLGSVLTTLHLWHAGEVAEALGIPDTVTQCALLPVAHTVGTDFRPAKRRPIQEVTYWDGWKA